MKKLLCTLGIILVILLGIYFQNKFCCGGACPFISKSKKEVKVNLESNLLAPFSLKTNGLNIDCKDNFNFPTSSYVMQQPISASLTGAIGKLKNFLLENPNKGLNLKGLYGSFEKNISLFSNLGLARANAVKGFFIKNGINKKQLAISSELSDNVKEGSSWLKGAVGYEFFDNNKESFLEKLKSLKLFGDNLKKEPLTLYFKTGASQINLTQEEREEIKKIGEYLTNVDDSKLLIVGHSDNTGKQDTNVTLSKKRAEFVKAYFVKNGFLEETIETLGLGDAQPIADNKTDEGRAKNRRVTISIK